MIAIICLQYLNIKVLSEICIYLHIYLYIYMKGVHVCKHMYTQSQIFLLLIQEGKPILQSHYV